MSQRTLPICAHGVLPTGCECAIILLSGIIRDPATRKAGDVVEETLTIQLPGEIRQMLNRTPEELARDVRLYSALILFRLGKLSSGAAAEMAGLPRVVFLDLCAEYDIPVTQITGEDLRRELASV
jgi:predicted HTH domain antitoxin